MPTIQNTFTPLQWKNGINPKSQGSFQNFMKQLADWANNQQQQLVALQSQVNATFFNPKTQALGTVTINQTVNCSNTNSVVLSLSINANPLTLTLANLGVGVPVWIVMTNTLASAVFKITASTPAPASYTVTAIGTGGSFDMGAGFTSDPRTTTYTFFGNSLSTGPNLYLSLT